jgi:hypothetical protein
MSSKKPCINYPSCTYTGKEQSPLRFGLSAEGYSVNSVIEGYDKNLWVVEIKNNKKVWVKREENFDITPEEPVMKCTITQTLPVETSSIHEPCIILSQIPEKKTTDYNLYLSYRLSQLKQSNPDNDNKTNFASVVQEWKVIKNIPEELKKVIEEAKQFALSNPVKKSTHKKPTKTKPLPEAVAAEPSPVLPEPSPVLPEPSPVLPEPSPVLPEPSPVLQEPDLAGATELAADAKIKKSKRKVTKK